MFPCTLKTEYIDWQQLLKETFVQICNQFLMIMLHIPRTFCPEQMMQLHTAHSFLNVLTAGVKFCNLL